MIVIMVPLCTIATKDSVRLASLIYSCVTNYLEEGCEGAGKFIPSLLVVCWELLSISILPLVLIMTSLHTAL